jgi:DNA-binding Xre family transcriptional regulator
MRETSKTLQVIYAWETIKMIEESNHPLKEKLIEFMANVMDNLDKKPNKQYSLRTNRFRHDFHEFWSKLLHSKKVTQKELAEFIGIRQQSVAHWNKRERVPRKHFNSVCSYLNLTQEEENKLLEFSARSPFREHRA